MPSRRPKRRGRCSWFRQVLGACLGTAAAPSVGGDRARVHTHPRQVESGESADRRRVRQSAPQSSGRLARSHSSHVWPGLLPAELPRSALPSATTKRLAVGGQGARCQCANHGLSVQSAQKGTTGQTAKPGRVQARRLSRMARCVAMIVLSAVQEQQLTAWARAAKTPQRLARRARVILGSAAGLGSRRLAHQQQMSRTTVQRWRTRFMAAGCDGLQDRPRRGRPSLLRPTTRALVVALACEPPDERNAVRECVGRLDREQPDHELVADVRC